MRLRAALALSLLFPLCAFAQTTKQHAGKPITTEPCPTPAEAQKKMKVPEGFEVRLFAAEPDVVNPVAMTWDTKGRLWVLELYEYPKGAPKGQKGRDRIIILEDTDGDGKADKRTVWYEGLSLACGLIYGNYKGESGVFVGQAPLFLFIPEKADGTAGEPKVIRGGFGLEDRHELVNGFNWGPDGRLYMTHGVFTRSYVKDPQDPNDAGVKIDAAVARFDPRTNKFEQFADGMSNQWGVDFNREGQAFVSACVIDHLFHVAPGGIYVRQAGTPGFPYAYELLKSIVKHRHQKAAYCGICCVQNGHWPAEYQQNLLMGNIHGHVINRDKVARNGSSYAADDAGDFLIANDGWFMPTSSQFGPDGELWVADWCDRYPCYQNAQADPEGVDREKGRIWRVVYTGKDAGKKVACRPEGMGDLAKLSGTELVKFLENSNIWQRRQATRLLITGQSDEVVPALQKLAGDASKSLDARLAAFNALRAFPYKSLLAANKESPWGCHPEDAEPALRAAVARHAGESRATGTDPVTAGFVLVRLSRDADPMVRREAAHAIRRLTAGAPDADVTALITSLLEQPKTAEDPMLPFFIWMAAEPQVAKDAKPLLDALAEMDDGPAAGQFARRAMRRLCDTGKPERLDEAVAFLEELPLNRLTVGQAAFEGLLEGMKGKKLRPARTAAAALAKWTGTPHDGFGGKARQLGALWGDAGSTEILLRVINEPKASEPDRVAGIRTARQLKTDGARDALLKALGTETGENIVGEILRALGDVGGDNVAGEILKRWKAFSPENKRTAADVLASRTAWALPLLAAVADKSVLPAEIPISAMRSLAQSDDKLVKEKFAAALGRFRPTNAERAKLIADKKAIVINGPVDAKVGEAMFAKHCMVCHTMHGRGAQVGPDITGVGRSSLDALLHNVLDPNEVIGKGYEQVIVRTKDDRTVSGRLVEDTAAHVKILSAGPKEDIVAKADIDGMKVTDVSVMPEGVEKQMTDAEFRSLIWYVLSPPQDTDKKVRIELGDKKLVVRSRVATAPGGGGGAAVGQDPEIWTELVAYVLDPALRPYLHPVRDPSGTVVLTEDKPGDHPWQHGIFTGLHKVGTESVDFWSEKTGKQKFVKLLDVQQGTDRVSWRSLTEWNSPAGPALLQEEQTVTVYAPAAEHYVIDFDWTLRSTGPTVPIGKHEYGGFSVRMKFDPKHTHLNSAGQTGGKTAEQKAAWTNIAAPFGGDTYGIAVLDHPTNFRHPNQWRVDGQGMINPSPSLAGGWMLQGKQEMTFRYRLVVHKGAGPADLLNREFEKFSALHIGPPAPTTMGK